MSDITQILSALGPDNPVTTTELVAIVYDRLRRIAAAKLAKESPGHTLQATALVHEVYLKLIGPGDDRRWSDCSAFFLAASQAMRSIIIDHARHKHSLRRGGGWRRVELADEALTEPEFGQPDLLALDEALSRLAGAFPRKARLVELRFFAGLTIPQAAQVLKIGQATAENDWAYARSWLKVELSGAAVP